MNLMYNIWIMIVWQNQKTYVWLLAEKTGHDHYLYVLNNMTSNT